MILATSSVSTVGPPIWIWILLLVACSVAAVTDIRETRIPNWLTLPLILTGLVQAPILGGLPGLGDSAIGMVIASALFIWAYAFFGGGAGDAKFMMGLGLWLGYEAAFVVTVAITIVGFVFSMFGVVIRGDIRDIPIVILTGWARTGRAVGRVLTGQIIERSAEEIEAATIKGRRRPKGWIPFAPAILGGTLLGWWYLSTYGPII
ncbi:MAG: hypothetical protein CMJ23_09515 [Phycisphaerae bacterium]|nr:hypothetical protein [Phycisphaerae bacterium]